MEYNDQLCDEQALKEFLLDIECLDPLSAWTSKFNLFDILRIKRVEIRHSNMLAWLVNPSENHGLGDEIIRGFIRFVVSSFGENEDVFSTLLMDGYDFSILREWRNIDLLAVSPKERFVLCIENKIDSTEHDDQLTRYRAIVDETYPEFKKMYIYLSPDGAEPSDSAFWCSMSYEDVLSIISNARSKVQLLPDAELLIDNYVEAIRRDIVGDERLAQICAAIYAKHQRALDLIFENKPDRASDVADIFKRWTVMKAATGQIVAAPEKCCKSYARFKTPFMTEILPDVDGAQSGWNTPNYYFYEICNNGGLGFRIQLALSSRNIPAELRAVCDRINAHFPSRQQKENWQWRTPFSTRSSKIDEELDEDKVYEQLDKRFDEVLAFENKLKELFLSAPEQQ